MLRQVLKTLSFLIIAAFAGGSVASAAEHWQSDKQTIAGSGNAKLYLDLTMAGNGAFQGAYGVYMCSGTPIPGSCRNGVRCMYPCSAPKSLSQVSGSVDLAQKIGKIRLDGLCSGAERPFQVIENKPGMLNMKIDVQGCSLGGSNAASGKSYEHLYGLVRQK